MVDPLMEIRCERDYHSNLWPHARIGDVKQFPVPVWRQLMDDSPVSFSYRPVRNANENQSSDHETHGGDDPPEAPKEAPRKRGRPPKVR